MLLENTILGKDPTLKQVK